MIEGAHYLNEIAAFPRCIRVRQTSLVPETGSPPNDSLKLQCNLTPTRELKMASSALAQMQSYREQRRSRRRRVLLSGQITYDDGRHSLGCTIRDISETGARVAIPRGQSLPPIVYLIDLRNQCAYEAKVVWRRTPEFGLYFIKAHALAHIEDPRLAYLSRLWLDCAAR